MRVTRFNPLWVLFNPWPKSYFPFFFFFRYNPIYDKECEADENKIWIKDEIKPQQISNHTRPHRVVIPKWKRETKKKKWKKYLFSNNRIPYESASSLYVVELVTRRGGSGRAGRGSSVAKVSLLTERGNSCEKTHKILVRSSLHLQILRNTTRIYET